MLRTTTLALAVLAACLSAATDAAAQERERARQEREQQAEQTRSFLDAERRLLTDYFAEHQFEAQRLPPGIARNLARGKPLPPGIAKRSLPPELAEALPEREGVEITIFGDRIVLLEASGLVVDIIEGVFR